MAVHTENAAELARLLKVIADETRLKILGALADQPLTGADLAVRLNLTPPTISHHMRKLTDAGIVTSETDAQRHWYRLNADFLLATRRTPIASAQSCPTSQAGDSDEDGAFRSKIIRDFFIGERLRDIPAQRKKRVIVLQHILQRFDAGRTYPESEVNDLLRPVHEDVATLRRELVDYGFMERDRGVYQVSRAGPQRSKQVAQEITGSEQTWLQSLLERVARSPLGVE
jgi:DNA-binding HxlR family transcriptional regulator